MRGRCGQEDCDCGYDIQRLEHMVWRQRGWLVQARIETQQLLNYITQAIRTIDKETRPGE